MITSFFKKSNLNQDLKNYCLKSTNNSIIKIVEHYDKERNKHKYNLPYIIQFFQNQSSQNKSSQIITSQNPSSQEPNDSNIILASIFLFSITIFMRNYFYNSKGKYVFFY